RKPPDPAGARARIAAALAKVDEASRSPLAEKGRLDALRADAALLEDRLDGVVIDLDRIAAGSKPLQIIGNVNGLYVADPGAGRLWRIFGDPLQTGVVMQRGDKGVGAPSLLTWQSDVLFVLDDSRKIWRAEGNQVNDVTPDDNTIWKSTTAIAVFTQNLYVLDAASGQLWKHESPDSISFTKGTAYLATAASYCGWPFRRRSPPRRRSTSPKGRAWRTRCMARRSWRRAWTVRTALGARWSAR